MNKNSQLVSQHILGFTLTFATVLVATALANETQEGQITMSASGTFEVHLEPQKDDYAQAGRMIISKTYTGALEGTGIGQMISKQTNNGIAVYSAIEEFDGKVNGKAGGFTLIHNGYMSSEGQSLEVKILEASGSGQLENISGELEIIQKDGVHKYELKYEL